MNSAWLADEPTRASCEAPHMDAKNLAPTLDNEDNCALGHLGARIARLARFP